MEDLAMVVLTSKPLETMFDDGGCGYWVANEKSIRKCQFVVATVNKRAWHSAPLPHGCAFMLGKIAGVSVNNNGRALVRISEYVEIAQENVWQPNGSNPVRYQSLGALGISLKAIDKNRKWQPWPNTTGSIEGSPNRRLTVTEAKLGLAETFGISPDQIEIIIKA